MFGGGGSAFGAPASAFGQQQQPQSTFNFANPSFGTTATPFGQTQQQQQAPSIFATPSFGSTTTNPFGQPQQQTTGLLGSTPTFNTTFGQPQQASTSAGIFGTTTNFGQPFNATTTQSQPFGSSTTQSQPFGSSTTQSQPFGSSTAQSQPFGSSTTQSQPFGPSTTFSQPFGTSTTSQPFGGTSTTFSQPFGSTSTTFGQPLGTTSAFGTSTFGQPQQQQPQQQQSSLFGGFNTGTFGQQQPATSAPTFNFTGASQPTTSLGSGFNFNAGSFGTTSSTAATTAPPFLNFGTKPLTTTAPFSFSTPNVGTLGQTQPSSSIFSSFQAQPFQQQSYFQSQQPLQQQALQFQPLQTQQQAAQPQLDDSHAFYLSIFQCHKFGDERDTVLANLNFVQAGWGRGKGYYSQSFGPVTYTPSNPFYRFKAVSYEYIQTENNEDGHITLEVKKSEEKVRQEETQLITHLQNMLGRPNIFFKISGIKKLDEENTTINLYADDKSTLRRVPATDLATALLQPHLKTHLDTLNIENVLTKIRPSQEQLKKYLDEAPSGIDPRVWKRAQEDNPDPVNMIPKPIIGIAALKKRAAFQANESKQHLFRLHLIEEDMQVVQGRHTNMMAELKQLKRKQEELSQRLLTVIVRQETSRKDGTTIQAEEEDLNTALCTLDDRFNSPTEFKGVLNEILSQVRQSTTHGDGEIKWSIDDDTLVEIRNFLETQHVSMQALVDTIRDDMDQLKLVSESLSEISNKK